ncbi:MAG: hypothetical protein GY696_13225, partial [Gammaproteobacteria bacterium]|nr:hypothetical protein [Gammaproteobacteria bacterium]
YRNCHRRQREEENKKRGGQNNLGSRLGGTHIVEDIPASPPADQPVESAKDEAWKMQNAIGVPAQVDPYSLCFAQMASHADQLSSLHGEVRDLRMASLHQVNCAIVSEYSEDAAILERLIQPEEIAMDEWLSGEEGEISPTSGIHSALESYSIAKSVVAQEGDGTIPVKGLEEKKLNTLSEGEQTTMKMSQTLSGAQGPRPRAMNARPASPTIWPTLLTTYLVVHESLVPGVG